MNKIRLIALFLFAFLPMSIKRKLYKHYFGWDIHPSAKIGLSLIAVQHLKMGPKSVIGHFCVIKNIAHFEIGESSVIGSSNVFTAIPLHSKRHFSHETTRVPSFTMGNNSGITQRHFFDCNNLIEIGDFSLVAGFNCSFFTHSINIERNRQETAPIKIGHYTMIGACSVITRGAQLPSYSILAANSTLHKAHTESYSLYSGVPAIKIKQLHEKSEFFHRKQRFVS